jgi:hypothetical protein
MFCKFGSLADRRPGRRHRLIQLSMNAPIGRNLMRQSVGVDTFQFLQLAIVNNQARQFMSQRQLFQHRFTG